MDGTFADLTGGEEEPSEEAIDAVRKNYQETRELLLKVMEKDGLKDRSGLLALLELENRALAHDLADGTFGRITVRKKLTSQIDSTVLLGLLKEYLEKIGDKACCYEDLKPYIDLEEESLAEWTSFLDALPTSFVRKPHSDVRKTN